MSKKRTLFVIKLAMLLSLIETKEFCEEQAKNFCKEKLALSAHQWDGIENITVAQLH